MHARFLLIQFSHFFFKDRPQGEAVKKHECDTGSNGVTVALKNPELDCVHLTSKPFRWILI